MKAIVNQLKPHRQQHILAVCFSLLLIFMQTTSLLHAEAHLFHTADELCQIYISAEHHSADTPSVQAPLTENLKLNDKPPFIVVSVPTHNQRLVFHSRAPPSII